MRMTVREMRIPVRFFENTHITPQVLNEHIYRWLARANNRIHATTKQKPSVMFAQEKDNLLPYMAQVIEKAGITYTKALPHVVVQKPVLLEYDQLLGTEVVA